MSTGHLQRHRSTSRSSRQSSQKGSLPSSHPSSFDKSSSNQSSNRSDLGQFAPAPSVTPFDESAALRTCAATAAFFLYAQGSKILCLHHDTLAIERRFERHREDIIWISVDNVSERGAGRQVVSYDAGNTAIVWDLLTGNEIARFASYEHIRIATWMRNGNVAFGNAQGNVILFEPETSEHISARTIFDPITALAPAADCRTFAIGYQNGSILIAQLQPSFTILHTLTTQRAPSSIAGLAWHGSSAKQKSEMLATQMADGDLRVWSVPKPPSTDAPVVIRVLNRTDNRELGAHWFGWSKNGRIIQFSEEQTLAWDVRTKKVTYDQIGTIEGVTGVANYGPTATLFTLGPSHTVQQYDVNPNSAPMLVANVQHVPANAPPSPPNSIGGRSEQKTLADAGANIGGPALPVYLDSSSSEPEGTPMSPLQKIANEMDALEEERRDRLAPLSPTSSRSSASSRESGKRRRNYRSARASPSNASEGTGTIFSGGSSSILHSSGGSIRDSSGRESISLRSLSSTSSYKYQTSRLRKEVQRSPDQKQPIMNIDLFPYVKARISETQFMPPNYGEHRTPDDLRMQMLRTVFGWEDDIDSLVRDELSRHPHGSASGVLLSKWLGETGPDSLEAMMGSDLSESDWMLLALSTMHDSQKKIGQAFVQRLLSKGDVHPAVAILLGLGEENDAIEVYVSRRHFMEAVLLTCLLFPHDWNRQSYLVRKWGERAVTEGQPELAVRCFACTSLTSSEPWFSPNAQDAVYHAQKTQLLGSQLSPPISPPVTGPSRMKNSGLKLTTSFGGGPRPQVLSETSDQPTPMNLHAHPPVTPIAESALSPSGQTSAWMGRRAGDISARTATPGGAQRVRFPSKADSDRSTASRADLAASRLKPDRNMLRVADNSMAPQTAVDMTDHKREEQLAAELATRKRSTSQNSRHSAYTLSSSVYNPGRSKTRDKLPPPTNDAFSMLKQEARARNGSRERMPRGLQLEMNETIVVQDLPTGHTGSINSAMASSHAASELSPPLTSDSLQNSKVRSIDQFISSLEEANNYQSQDRTASKSRQEQRTASRTESRTESRTGSRAESRRRARDQSTESRGRSGAKYIRPAKRSPSSPVPMSPEDPPFFINPEAPHGSEERYYRSVLTDESRHGRDRSRSALRTGSSRNRSVSKPSRRAQSPDDGLPRNRPPSRSTVRTPAQRGTSATRSVTADRGRSASRGDGAIARSPESPKPLSPEDIMFADSEAESRASHKSRNRSASRRAQGRGASTTREGSVDGRRSERQRERSAPREPMERSPMEYHDPMPQPLSERVTALSMSQKERAARELEERRLSLLRRPSAPMIPHPDELNGQRPGLGNRSQTDLGLNPISYLPPLSSGSDEGKDMPFRSQSVDQDEASRRSNSRPPTAGTSGSFVPMGLPATPRAMKHPRYMGNPDPSDRDDIPAVPEVPGGLNIQGAATEAAEQDDLPPLLPSTVYGQESSFPRSASAPLEKSMGLPATTYNPHQPQLSHSRQSSYNLRQHVRGSSYSDNKRISPTMVGSIAETLHEVTHEEEQVVVVGGDINVQDAKAPSVLPPELQHLATPPPPPPPPFIQHNQVPSLGTINIAIDTQPQSSRSNTPAVAIEGASPISQTTTSPISGHRRGRGSISESFGDRIRKVSERIRTSSRSRERSRVRSPPNASDNPSSYTPSPYESVLPPMPGVASANRSPKEGVRAGEFAALPGSAQGSRRPSIQQSGTPAPMEEGQSLSRPGTAPGTNKRFDSYEGYRNPKEVRANMPPEQFQRGVPNPPDMHAGMI